MRVVIDNGGTDWLTPLATLLAGRRRRSGQLGSLSAGFADKRVERERQVAKDRAAADAAVQARIDEAEMRTAARLIHDLRWLTHPRLDNPHRHFWLEL